MYCIAGVTASAKSACESGPAASVPPVPRTVNVPDGEYRWYDVLTWIPAPDEFFWIGPGRFTADGKSPVNGVYIDKIKFEEVADRP